MSGKRDCECPRSQHEHGTYEAYNADGCRCPECQRAAAQQRAVNRRKRLYRTWNIGDPNPYINAVGSHRRLQALTRIGWTAPRLAEHLAISTHQVRKLRSGIYPTIQPATAQRIVEVYDQLWDKPQRDANACRAMAVAKRLDWKVPIEWDDDEIDNPDAEPWQPSTRSVPRDLRPCGTDAAYRRHIRRGEPIDAACAAAGRREAQDRKTKKRAA